MRYIVKQRDEETKENNYVEIALAHHGIRNSKLNVKNGRRKDESTEFKEMVKLNQFMPF